MFKKVKKNRNKRRENRRYRKKGKTDQNKICTVKNTSV